MAMMRCRSFSVCIRKREMHFTYLLKKNLRKRYRGNDVSEILPLKRTMGMPSLSAGEKQIGPEFRLRNEKEAGSDFLNHPPNDEGMIQREKQNGIGFEGSLFLPSRSPCGSSLSRPFHIAESPS